MEQNANPIQFSDDDVYWALDTPQRVAETMTAARKVYESSLRSRGQFDLWVRSFREYYGMTTDGMSHETSVISFVGDQGEAAYARANHFRNLIRHRVVMATSTRPNFEPQPASQTVEALVQIPLARNVINYEMRRFEQQPKQALEAAALGFARAYVWMPWNRNKGPVAQTTPGFHETDQLDDAGNVIAMAGEPNGNDTVKYDGDFDCRMLTPIDVMEPPCADVNDVPWREVRVRENRYDLIARYPEKADEIRGIQVAREVEPLTFLHAEADQDSDEIYVHYLYVAKSPAAPDGRYTVIVGGEAVEDGPLPYDKIPVFRIAPTEMVGTSFGYADAHDLMGLSRAYNSIMSTILTGTDALGMPNIAKSSGTHLSHDAVAGGLRIWDVPSGEDFPKVIQMMRINQEDMALANHYRNDMEIVSGINAAKRGDPASNIKSAKMAGLMDSMASQYNAGDQQSYTRLVEEIATHVLQCIQRFSTVERLVPMGADSLDAVVSFKAEDVSLIRSVTITAEANALRSPDGRWMIAEKMFDKGEINGTEMIEFLNTGKLPEKNKNTVTQRALALRENAMLMKPQRVVKVPGDPIKNTMTGMMMPGPPMDTTPDVPVLVTDDHPTHMQILNVQLASPLVRSNQELLASHMAHMDWHKRLASQADPMLLMLLSIPQGQPAMPPPPPGEPGTDGEPGPKPGTEQEEQTATEANPSRSARPPEQQKG
jgi:hypothetical protein